MNNIEKLIPIGYLKQTLTKIHVEEFNSSLNILSESLKNRNRSIEESDKTLVIKFLQDTLLHPAHFPANAVNYDVSPLGGNIDLAVFPRQNNKKTPYILIEMKAAQNSSEMISYSNFNKKALQELVWYFWKEEAQQNHEIKYLIASNGVEWFVFDSHDFKRITAKFEKIYCDFSQGLFSSDKTSAFYKLIEEESQDFFDRLKNIAYYFNLDVYTGKNLENTDEATKIIELYKVFSPYTLLKHPHTTNANTLDPNFYKELLYIMGLEEINENNIAKIKYQKLSIKDNNNLMKLVLDKLDIAKLRALPGWESIANADEERTEEIALELVLTWVNRILFLKLLEAQLISYHSNTPEADQYRILSPINLNRWHKVSELFFNILAKPTAERSSTHIPYLNSSLFEKTSYENVLSIDMLNPDTSLSPINKNLKANTTLEYLLSFLDSYDFGANADALQDKAKPLINASVLGLVFEKINGYKDGAVFTPSFITMSMARESLRNTVIQKFNEAYQWNCKDFTALKNKIAKDDSLNVQELNNTFNSIRVCDPAVGSGHFLVSVLNELLLIKYELKILCKYEPKILCNTQREILSHCDMHIAYDELFIKYNGKEFKYTVSTENKPLSQEIQSLQETLFHEKETLIENCLFGVDINPKSAYICRLRLWIELLKNTYYIQNSNTPIDLQTLPNIDINIKIGNSLISRFPLKQNFAPYINALKGRGITMQNYQDAVTLYKKASNKSQKAQANQEIERIKESLREAFLHSDSEYTKLVSKRDGAKANYDSGKLNLFEVSGEKLQKLEDEYHKAEELLKKSGDIYQNSLEWRYEFPEVLDDEGDFLGFDLVIGNPPYFRYSRKIPSQGQQIDYFRSHDIYNTACIGKINAYEVFLLLSYHLCKAGGFICEIFQNSFLADTAAKGVRKHYIENTNILQINSFPERDNHKKRVFEDVKMSVLTLLTYKKGESSTLPINIYTDRMQIPPKEIETDISLIRQIDAENMEIPNLNKKELAVFAKCYTGTMKTEDIADVNEGELNLTFCSKYFTNDPTQTPFIVGANVQKYYITDTPSQRKVPLFFDKEKFLEENHQNKTEHFKLPRVIYQGITGVDDDSRLLATIGTPNTFCGNTIDYFIMTNPHYNIYFMVGLMNSWLLNWIFKARSTNAHTNTYEIKRLPIPQASPAEQEPIIDLVKQCMAAKAKDKNADISHLQRQIDKLVYDLYGLSEDEIKVVENR